VTLHGPHGPRSHDEILAMAEHEMTLEDEADERMATMQDAVQLWLAGRPTGLKHPRKTLRTYLAGRR
jgi:hypothetical protein